MSHHKHLWTRIGSLKRALPATERPELTPEEKAQREAAKAAREQALHDWYAQEVTK
jgi:hypothetical protein